MSLGFGAMMRRLGSLRQARFNLIRVQRRAYPEAFGNRIDVTRRSTSNKG
jgi:hypothetical protein